MKKQQTITRVTIFGRYLIILGTVEMVSNSFNHQDISVTLYENGYEMGEILDGETELEISHEFSTNQLSAIFSHAERNHELINTVNIILSQFSDN